MTLWPVEVENVRLSGLPIVAPANPAAAGAAGVLRITLKCASPEATFTQLGVDRLRFFLRGPTNQALALYELLGAPRHLDRLRRQRGRSRRRSSCPASAIEPVGFSPDEALLPWSARGFSGFRLLTEYFAFPEKFLFLDFTRIDAKTLVSGGNRLEIFVYLDRSLPELERTIGQQSLALGCTPLVNLFPQRCEPVTLSHQDTEYRIVPDARRPRAAEVWSVERVRETLPDGSFRPWRPFHRLTEGDPEPGVPGGFYHVARRAAAPGVPGTEVFLAPHDPDFDPGQAGRGRAVDRRALRQPRPAHRPAVRRRPSAPAPGRGRRRGRRAERRHRRHAHPAPAAARERLLAPGVASVARATCRSPAAPRAPPR